MADFNSDPWVAKHSPLSAEKLHALGYLTFNWSQSEYWSHAVFAVVMGADEGVARIVTHDMGDITMWEKARQIASKRGLPADVLAELDYAARLHERNRVNRNLYAHAVGDFPSDGRGMVLSRLKGPDMFNIQHLADDVSDLRRVGEEIGAMRRYLDDVALYAWDRQQGGPQVPSPERPPLPALVWTPPPPKPQARKRPPRSSQA